MELKTDSERLGLIKELTNLNIEDGYSVEIKKINRRTGQQNNALHKYFELLAQALNDAGFDKRATFEKMKEGVEIGWDKESIKKDLFQKIMVAITEKESTAQLSREEVSKCYMTLNRWTASELGVSVEFPSEG